MDILTPSKAIQQAKDKLGPSFFDETLVESSRNAIELTKLVGKWNDIDRKKMKYIKELYLEQERLIRTLKSHKERIEDDPVASIEGVETADGKTIPPGFRFKSNGELKTSITGLSTVNLHESTDGGIDRKEINDRQKYENSASTPNDEKESSIRRPRKHLTDVDYDKEIREIEAVLFGIYKTLLKNRLDLYKSTGGNIKTYLRGHRNEYIPTKEILDDVFEKPNARFAFKPGSPKGQSLSKKKISNPTHRHCVGCQFKLKATSEPVKTIVRGKEDVGKLRWSYVPQGRYVKSMSALSTVSLSSKPSKVVSGSSVRLVDDMPHTGATKSEKLLKTLSLKDSGYQSEYNISDSKTGSEHHFYLRSKSAASRTGMDFDDGPASIVSGLGARRSGTALSWLSSRDSFGMVGSGSESLFRSNNRLGLSQVRRRQFSDILLDQKSRMKALKMMQVLDIIY